jgi:hypothetical protein
MGSPWEKSYLTPKVGVSAAVSSAGQERDAWFVQNAARSIELPLAWMNRITKQRRHRSQGLYGRAQQRVATGATESEWRAMIGGNCPGSTSVNTEN